MFQEQPPEEPRQHPHGREEARPAGNPSGAVQGQSAAGDEAIDVRMVMQVLAPAVQYGDEADLGYFYEWKKTATGKQPYAVGLQGGRLMAIAGLWETWRSPVGERVRSFAIVTTAANSLLAPVHDRMPVILAPENWPTWLGECAADPDELKSLLVPYPAEDMIIWPVDKRVGNVNNKDPSLIEPAAA